MLANGYIIKLQKTKKKKQTLKVQTLNHSVTLICIPRLHELEGTELMLGWYKVPPISYIWLLVCTL